MKIVVFKIPEEIKRSQDYLYFPFKLSVAECPAPALIQSDVLEGYKKHIKERREDERRAEFPAGARFIEPTIRLQKTFSKEQIPSRGMEKKNIRQEKETEFKTVKLKGLLKERGSFVLIADSGMGKTTILKELQYQIVSGNIPTEQIPVYFHFRDFLGVFSTENLLKRIVDSFPKEIERNAIERTVNLLFHQKRILFLLDGLDQVEDRSNLPRLLDRNGLFSPYQVIVAGRPYIYSSLQSLLSHYHYLTLDTFSIALAKEYLGEDAFEHLRNFIQDSSLRAPMLFSILKELGREAGQEMNRTQIYEKMIGHLLTREAYLQATQSFPVINKELFKDIFSRLSYSLLDKGYAGRFPWSIVDSLLQELKITWGDFVRLTHMGLISEIVEGQPLPDRDLVFRHQSFQEYLASLELKKRLFWQNKLNKEALINHLEYNKWDEVLSFLIGFLENTAAKDIIAFTFRYDIILTGRCIANYKGNKDEDFRGIIDELLIKLKDGDVRWAVAAALGNIGSEMTIDYLISLLSDKDSSLCRVAAKVLGNIGSEMVVDSLIPLLNDKNEGVRGAAAHTLGTIGSERAVDSLIPLLNNKNEGVRWAAAHALGTIGSEKAVDSFIPLLNNKNEGVRWAAADVLGKIGSEKAVNRLITLLSDEEVYLEAAYALGMIGSEKAVDSLISLLNDKNKSVRRAAADALGKIGSEKAVNRLITLLSDKEVYLEAAYALGTIGSEKAVDSLIPLLNDKDKYVRKTAANALGTIGSEKAVDSLIPLLSDEDKYVRKTAANALGTIGSEKAVDSLILLLSDEDVREVAADVLGKIGSERAVNHLIPLLSDEDVRWVAADALGKIGSERAVNRLIPLLSDEDFDVRRVAAGALGNISKKFKENDLFRLVEGLHNKKHNNAVDALKHVHQRRFLKILYPESSRIIK